MSKSLLELIKDQESKMQTNIEDKIARGLELTDEEVASYKLNAEDAEIFEIFKRATDGENVPGFNLKDFLASPQAKVLIPRIIVGAMRKSSAPCYLASNFYKKIKLKSGQAVMFPSVGVMRAHDIAEGQEINYGVSAA